jgi:hypothetical protein
MRNPDTLSHFPDDAIALFILTIAAILTNCSLSPTAALIPEETTTPISMAGIDEDPTYLTPIPESTLAAFDWEVPIENKLQAAIAGLANLGTSRLHYVETPRVVLVDKLKPEEAHQRTAQHGVLNTDSIPEDRRVWLVVFEGDYQIIPPDPVDTFTPRPPIHGCSFVIMDPNDSSWSEIGTMDCPPGYE